MKKIDLGFSKVSKAFRMYCWVVRGEISYTNLYIFVQSPHLEFYDHFSSFSGLYMLASMGIYMYMYMYLQVILCLALS